MNIRLEENEVVPCARTDGQTDLRQTDRHDEVDIRFWQF